MAPCLHKPFPGPWREPWLCVHQVLCFCKLQSVFTLLSVKTLPSLPPPEVRPLWNGLCLLEDGAGVGLNCEYVVLSVICQGIFRKVEETSEKLQIPELEIHKEYTILGHL